MKYLLMISYPFPPNASAGAVRSEHFARYLPNYDWTVNVITIKPRHDIFEDRTRVEALRKNVNVHFTNTLDPWLWLKDKKTYNIFLKVARSILMKLFSFPDHMLLWVPFAVRTGLEICRYTPIDGRNSLQSITKKRKMGHSPSFIQAPFILALSPMACFMPLPLGVMDNIYRTFIL